LITIGADRSERVIFPFGLYSASGFWYCACVDDARGHNVSLRADRFVSVARLEGRARPDHIPLDAWLKVIEHDGGTGLPLRARVTGRRERKPPFSTRLFGRQVESPVRLKWFQWTGAT